MDQSKLPEECPKCGERQPVGFNFYKPYWHPLYCRVMTFSNGAMKCGRAGHEEQKTDHLFIRCYCGYEFGFRPCEDANKEKARAA